MPVKKIAVIQYLFDLCLMITPFVSGESRKGVLGSRGPPAATGQPAPTRGVSDCSVTTKKIHRVVLQHDRPAMIDLPLTSRESLGYMVDQQ